MAAVSAQLLWLLRGSGSATVGELVDVIDDEKITAVVIQRALFDGTSLFEHDGASPPRWRVLTGEDFPLTRLVPGLALRAWQEHALQEWLAADKHAVVEAVTGTGKTAVGLIAIADAVQRGLKVVVLVPSINLMEQWARSLWRYLPRVRVGRQGDGSSDSLRTHDVLLSMVQSASRKAPFDGESRCLLVADEVHRYGASSFARTLSIGFLERLGLTATYERADDSVDTVLRPFFGATIDGCSYRRGYDEGILAPIRLMTVGVAFTLEEQRDYDEADERAKSSRSQLVGQFGVASAPFGTFMAEVEALSKDAGKGPGCWAARKYLKAFSARRAVLANSDAKLRLLAGLAPVLRGPARSIVFSETIEAADRAADQLSAGDVPVASMTSGATPRERDALLDKFRVGELSVLATAKLLDEGIDIPEAEVGIILAASKTRRQMIQRMGRIIRPKADGRHATFVIVYVAGTSEDPATGAHETFLEQITDIAVEVNRAAASEAVEILADWLAVDAATVGGATEPESLDAVPESADVVIEDLAASEPEDWTVEAIVDIVDEFEGIATWTELTDLLPDDEVRYTLLSGDIGGRINWIPVGTELVCFGGRHPVEKSVRVKTLTTVSAVYRRSESVGSSMTALRGELGTCLSNVSDVRLRDFWESLGTLEPDTATNTVVALPVSQPATLVAPRVEPASDVEVAHQQFVSIVERSGATAHRVANTRRTAFAIRHPDGRRYVARVRVRTGGDWQGQKSDEDRSRDDTHADVWVFVDYSVTPINFYIVPAHEFVTSVRQDVDDWVAKDPSRTRQGHHAVRLDAIKHGRDRWDLLGIGLSTSVASTGSLSRRGPIVNSVSAQTVKPLVRTKGDLTILKGKEKKAARETAATRSKTIRPMSGVGHVRVRLDCFGQRVSGVYDPNTDQIEITRAMRSPRLVGRRYVSASDAASEVKKFIGGGKRAVAETSKWTYDDGSGTILD